MLTISGGTVAGDPSPHLYLDGGYFASALTVCWNPERGRQRLYRIRLNTTTGSGVFVSGGIRELGTRTCWLAEMAPTVPPELRH